MQLRPAEIPHTRRSARQSRSHDRHPVARREDRAGIVVAALFLPFLFQVLAIGHGLWAGNRGLASQGVAALTLSTGVSIVAGAAIVIGVGAGLVSADAAGRPSPSAQR